MDVVGDIMTKKVATCGSKASIMDVRELMRGRRISRVVAVDAGDRPVGVVTQKDIIRFLTADKSKRGLEEIRVEEPMSRVLVTIAPDASVSDAARSMAKRKISSLIVVDKDGIVKGIVTKADLCLHLASKGAGVFKVRDYMTKNPVAVWPTQSMFVASSLMSEHGISRVAVIDTEKKPVGIITLADLTMIGSLLKPPKVLMEGKPIQVEGGITLPSSLHLLTASDIMSGNPISIEEGADLSDAAKLMTRHGISGLPVVDKSGRLVGIVTKSDITRALSSME